MTREVKSNGEINTLATTGPSAVWQLLEPWVFFNQLFKLENKSQKVCIGRKKIMRILIKRRLTAKNAALKLCVSSVFETNNSRTGVCVWSVVTSELHGSQVSAGRHRGQHALRQTLGLLRRVAATRPVRSPRVSFVAVTTAFKASWGHDTHRGRSGGGEMVSSFTLETKYCFGTWLNKPLNKIKKSWIYSLMLKLSNTKTGDTAGPHSG